MTADQRKYRCAKCGGDFVSDWTDTEAQAEADAMWGDIDDPAVVCDDCWVAMGLA